MGHSFCILYLILVLFSSNPKANYILTNIQLDYVAINRTAPEPAEEIVLIGTSVKQIMAKAASGNARYEFGGTYYKDKGWLIEKYDNVSNDLSNNYCWFYYVKTQYDKQPEKQTIGVSNCLITVNATLILFRYEVDKVYCRPSQDLSGIRVDV